MKTCRKPLCLMQLGVGAPAAPLLQRSGKLHRPQRQTASAVPSRLQPLHPLEDCKWRQTSSGDSFRNTTPSPLAGIHVPNALPSCRIHVMLSRCLKHSLAEGKLLALFAPPPLFPSTHSIYSLPTPSQLLQSNLSIPSTPLSLHPQYTTQ